MKKYYRWILINLLFPLSPFVLRIFVWLMGKDESISLMRIAELPEILFFSIYLCVANLNINLYGKKGYFESILRIFLGIILVLDCVALGMIYSDNIGNKGYFYSIFAMIFPAAIAPIYKFKYKRSING
ncbi:MAG: hypothetical protein M1495_13500 [Bacteroidetes bacterium]|nr:hypothetical protein [Bacteroidota bacterium]